MKYNIFAIAVFILSLSAPAGAFQSDWGVSENIKARVIAEKGKFGVEMEAAPGWHTYYKDSGDAGIPTTFDWTGTKDITITEVIFPKYKVITEYDLKTNAYEGRFFFPVIADFHKNPHVSVKVDGAVCKEICIPYSIHINAKLPENYTPVESASKEDISGSYAAIIWTAFLAGLILNIMPCVLPVLSLKVLSVIKQSGAEKKHARWNFAATATGIIFSFWILAVIAISLKNAGMAVGWGLHFQSPIFVGVLLVIVLIFASSLFGLFHLRPPSWIAGSGSHNTTMGNFFSGMLATLLGTSCTAPLLVTAVGFALSRSELDIFLIFTVMGIGMALPFLIFAFRPQIANILPKPGKWMNKVKFVLGLFLLGTAVWLGYVLYSQLAAPSHVEAVQGQKQWEDFDEAKIVSYVTSGKTVFVDITAEWCVNCKANKAAVIDTDEITKLFARDDIVLMRGDMTRPNKVLVSYIKKYNRYGIPFNMVYGPSSPDGVLLPALLTKSIVKEAVGKASGR